MKGGDTNEKNGDRVGISSRDALCRCFIRSGPNQEPFQGSDEGPGPDSDPGPTEEPDQRSDSDQRSRKGWLLQDHEITIKTLSEKKGYKMKKLTVTALLLLLLSSVSAYAGNGNCGIGQGRTNVCLTNLNTVEITGKVSDIGNHDGLVVDAGNSQVTIYGIGPEWYWEDKEVDRPEIGDVVKVVAYAVLFSDGTRYVASAITIGGETLILRDTNTGCPLWRGARNR